MRCNAAIHKALRPAWRSPTASEPYRFWSKDARRHPDPGSVARSGETLESRLCIPSRGKPGSRTLGSGPHSAHPVRRGESSRQGDSPDVTKRGLFGAKRKTLCGVADYQHRNRARMRYDEYLAKGWPIASGPVEGACKNLIKDRMERSGMRWTEEMAEPAQSYLLKRGLRSLLVLPHLKRSAAPSSWPLERRPKVATPN